MKQTLKDELRKVQSSAFLLEKQRNPGVGYWSAANHQANGSVSRLDGSVPMVEAPKEEVVGSNAKGKADEEEVNLEVRSFLLALPLFSWILSFLIVPN